jgi:hypothetical protein
MLPTNMQGAGGVYKQVEGHPQSLIATSLTMFRLATLHTRLLAISHNTTSPTKPRDEPAQHVQRSTPSSPLHAGARPGRPGSLFQDPLARG